MLYLNSKTTKKFFDMMKATEHNPVSRRNGVVKISFTHNQQLTIISLTAMPRMG